MSPVGTRLQRRILASFSVPLLLAVIISVASVVYLVDQLLMRQMQQKVASDLRSAREIYDNRLERLSQSVAFGANLATVREALAKKDAAELESALTALRVQQGEDILTVADVRGRVVARARNPGRRGDDVSHLSPVKAALLGETAASTEILTAVDLAAEGEDLSQMSRIELLPTPRARVGTSGVLDKAMTLFAASPVLDTGGRVIGALYAADVLNRDYAIVDKIRSTVFADVTFEGQSVGTATLFLDDMRISTNVPATGGNRAVGTRLSEEVADRVLKNGLRWIDRAFVVNDWYLSAYEPLYNLHDQVVGILYVGVLERPYQALMWRSVFVVGLLHAAGLTLGAILLTLALYRLVGRPLRVLSEGVKRIEAGDLSYAIELKSGDEIGHLATDFNAMTAALRERDAAIEALTRDLEAKVRERSSALERRNDELLAARGELLGMMEKQKLTNAELQRSLEQLRATQVELIRSGKLAALGSMAAGVAHEINNPLATIQGNLEILQLQLAGDPSHTDELRRIAEQIVRLQKIVHKLLTFARAESADIEPTDLEATVRQALDTVRANAEKAKVSVAIEIQPSLPPAAANGDRLVQVFVNLAKNAVEAMPGGGTLRVTAGLGQSGGDLYVRFEDTGRGIRPEDRERIWNPFYTTRASGTGLGLSISHAIVEELRGHIEIESEPGRGSAFTVWLPVAA